MSLNNPFVIAKRVHLLVLGKCVCVCEVFFFFVFVFFNLLKKFDMLANLAKYLYKISASMVCRI